MWDLLELRCKNCRNCYKQSVLTLDSHTQEYENKEIFRLGGKKSVYRLLIAHHDAY